MLRFKEKYKKEVILALQKQFGYKNVMAVPRIEKIVVNSGFGKLIGGKTADEQKKIIDEITQGLTLICGQRAMVTRAKKSIAGFKVRQGNPLGARVTMRGKKMEDFFDRLCHIVLPRSRDFRGISQESFDERGNLTIGIAEQVFFPEIVPEKIRTNFGLEISIQTTAKTREEGMALLKLFGFPIKS